jgi:hypothetical protein
MISGEGDGKKVPYLELVHRNTARAMHGPHGGIGAGERFKAVGFRCAKYFQPARDVLMLRQAAMNRMGVFGSETEQILADYRPANAYGVERTDYDATGGGNHTYVRGRTVVLGAIPLAKFPYAQVAEILSAAAETDPEKGGPQLFAWIYWNGDLEVEVQQEKIVEAPPVEEGAAGADDPKKDDDKKKDDKKKGGRKKNGKKEAAGGDGEEEEPAGPRIEKTRVFLPGDMKRPYFLGIVTGRLALFELKATGPARLGYLPVQTAAGQKAGEEVVVKEKPKDLAKRGESLRSAQIDPATGFVRLRFGIQTRSKTSPDIFVIDVVLKVKGTLAGTWRGYEGDDERGGK